MNIHNCKRIVVVGDSARGKSTLAKQLSKELDLKHIELDDIYWVTKYTQVRERKEQVVLVEELLKNEKEWVIEGATRHLVTPCLDKSDCIIHLRFKNILVQWFYVFRRGIKRKESLKKNIDLCYHLFTKRYGLGNSKGKKSVSEIVKDYSYKLIELNSWKEIDRFLSKISKTPL